MKAMQLTTHIREKLRVMFSAFPQSVSAKDALTTKASKSGKWESPICTGKPG